MECGLPKQTFNPRPEGSNRPKTEARGYIPNRRVIGAGHLLCTFSHIKNRISAIPTFSPRTDKKLAAIVNSRGCDFDIKPAIDIEAQENHLHCPLCGPKTTSDRFTTGERMESNSPALGILIRLCLQESSSIRAGTAGVLDAF